MGKNILEDKMLINNAITQASNDNFTGKMIITLNMNQGGIGNISVNMDKTLKKQRI